MASEDTIIAQRLECALCIQEPKQLICTHTFCQRCLAQLLQFQSGTNTLSCPLCRKITDLEDGDVSLLKTNYSTEVDDRRLGECQEGLYQL